jgi:hypothetical protein
MKKKVLVNGIKILIILRRENKIKRLNLMSDIARTNPQYFIYKWCRGWDLNPRRPAPEDLKSSSIS